MNKKSWLIVFFAFFTSLLAFIWYWPGQNLQVTFCDVGQGDAILFSRGFSQVLVDGGRGRKILQCLNDNMPMADKTVEVVILTHPEADHGQGLTYVGERYIMKYFVTGKIGSESEFYKKLLDIVSKQNARLLMVGKGDELTAAGVKFAFLWPDENWLSQQLSDKKTFTLLDPPSENIKKHHNISTGQILGTRRRLNFNDYSLVAHAFYKDFDVLLMGDADAGVQPKIAAVNEIGNPEVLKVAHHGAKEAFNPGFLQKAKAKLAVISVGENSWGHPDKTLIERLKKLGMVVKRTDQDGEIRIETDGQEWWLN